jgi:membrane associated rhomboid family serine protease
MPPATKALLAANVAVFLLQLQGGDALVRWFALWPLGPGFDIWQLVTYSFLHGSLTHILFNMFALYMFGGAMELVVGPRRYLAYYFVCVVSAAIAQLLVTGAMGGLYPTVGASGGVFGLLLAYAVYFPRNKVMLLFLPVPIPSRIFVVIYAAIELFLGLDGGRLMSLEGLVELTVDLRRRIVRVQLERQPEAIPRFGEQVCFLKFDTPGIKRLRAPTPDRHCPAIGFRL